VCMVSEGQEGASAKGKLNALYWNLIPPTGRKREDRRPSVIHWLAQWSGAGGQTRKARH